jgi:anthranilate/para-aminobenzoate synthase component II
MATRKCGPSRYNRRIGIVLMPGRSEANGSGADKTTITDSNVDWFAARGIEVIPIPHDTSAYDYYMRRIDGLYLQGGGTYSPAYYETCRQLLRRAIKENNAGRYFPVWGTCHGFQAMMILVGRMWPIGHFDAAGGYMAEIRWTAGARRSLMWQGLPAAFREHVTRPKSVFFNNEHGVGPRAFAENRELAAFFKPLAYARDRRGGSFVAVIEGRRYPFFGTQFHPERVPTLAPFCEFFVERLLAGRGTASRVSVDARHRLLHSRRKRGCYATKRFSELYTRKACLGRWPKLFRPGGCYTF